MKKTGFLFILSFMLCCLSAQKPDLILPVGYMGNVNTVVFSKDNQFVLTSSEDRTAKIWDAHRGKLLHNFQGHTDDVFIADFTMHGDNVITLSRDGSMKIWDMLTGDMVHSSQSSQSVNAGGIAISPDGKFILTHLESESEADSYGTLFLWDTQKDEWSLHYSLKGTVLSRLNPFAFSPDLSSFAFVSSDGFIKIADIKNGNPIHTLAKYTEGLYSADFSPDGKYFLTASEKSVKIWDVQAEKLISTINGAGYFAFSNDGRKIATISDYKSVKIYEIPSGEICYTMNPGEALREPRDVSFSPDDSRLLITSNDACLLIMDIRANKTLFVIEGGSPAVYSPDGKKIFTSANSQMGAWSTALDQIPKIWDAQTGKLLHRLEGHTNYVTTAKFSPDGNQILTDSWDNSAKLWDLKNGKLLSSLKGDQLLYKSVEFSPDGKYVLTTAPNEIAKLWDVAGGKLLFSMKGDTFVDRPRYGLEFKAKFSPNSKLIVTTYPSDPFVKVFDIETRTLKYTLRCPVPVNLVAFNSDDTELAVASGDDKARIWDLSQGKLKYILDDVENSYSYEEMPKVVPARISPDGSIVITFPFSKPAAIWDTRNGHVLYTLSDTLFPDFPFTSDSKSIITMAENDSAQVITTLRDSKSGRPLHTFTGFVANHYCSPDNDKIITFSGSRPVLDINVWDLKTGILLRRFPKAYSLQASDPDIIRFTPDGRKIITNNNGNAEVWDIHTGEMLKSIQLGSFGPVTISADSRFLLTDTESGKVNIWDMQVLQVVRSFDRYSEEEENPSSLESAIFSPDGSYYVTRFSGGLSKLWNNQTGELLKSFTQATDYMPDAGLEEGETKMQDDNPGKIKNDQIEESTESSQHDSLYNEFSALFENLDLENEPGSGDLIYAGGLITSGCSFSGPFSPDSKKILGDCDGAVMIWDIQNSTWLPKLENAGSYDESYRFTPDSKRVYKNFDNDIRWWDVLTGKQVLSMEGSYSGSSELVFSSDGSKTITTLPNGKTCLLNAASGKLLQGFDTIPVSPIVVHSDYNSPFKSLFFSPDNRYIATQDESAIKIWGGSDGKLLNTLGEGVYGYTASPFSPDSKSLAVNYFKSMNVSEDAPIIETRISNLPGGELKFSLAGKTIGSPFSPDGENILTIEKKNIFKLWNATSGKPKFDFGWDDQERIPGLVLFSPDGKNILTSSYYANDDGYIIKYEPIDLWSTKTGKITQNINIGSARPGDICWKDGLVNSFRNSMISLFDLKSGKEKVSFTAIEGNDYVFVLPTGEYMGTSGGVKYLSWRLNNKLYDFDQWDLQYNRPDKVLEQLGNPDTSLIMMYRKAYQKRLKKAGFTEAMFTSEWHTPESGILNADEFSTPVTNPLKNLKVRLSDTKYKLDRVNVWVNDVPIAGKNGTSLRKAKVSSIEQDIPLTLSSGLNKIQVSCINEKGVESLKEAMEITYKPTNESKPDLYVIVMSVSAYKDYRYDLRYAAKDGRDLVSMFNSKNPYRGEFNTIHMDTLFDANATREQFFALKQKLFETKVDDQVVVFISGHGLLDDNMDFYFATHDIDFNDPQKRGISFDDMESLLDSIPARKKLLMVDACHSGEVDKDDASQPVASISAGTTDFAFRGMVKSYSFRGVDAHYNPAGITLNTSFELMQELFAGLDKGTGTTVISAAAGDGYALESPQWNNGVFTYSIINGMKNKAADKNNDGVITISELKDYSIRQVNQLTGGQQKPTARREPIGIDWRIW